MQKQEISNMNRREVPIDLKKVYQKLYCVLCGTKLKVDLAKANSGWNCNHCSHVLKPNGPPFTTPIPIKIINILRDNMQRVTKSYKEDFIRDEENLANYEGSFLWGCRESGTDLALFDDFNGALILSTIIWIVGTDYYEAYNNNKHSVLSTKCRSKVIFYWDGTNLFIVSPDEAMKLWEDHVLNINR